jgi:hypothetical protein
MDVWGKGRPLTKRPAEWEAKVLARPRGRWPALVSDEVWLRARQRLVGHHRLPRQASGQHLLSGVARCPDCGSRMYGVLARGETARYRCGGWLADGDHTSHCFRTAKRDQVDQIVLEQVAALFEPLADAHLRRAVEKAWDELRRSEPNVDRARQRKRLEDSSAQLRQRLARATTKFVDDLITRSEYDALVKRTEADLVVIEGELAVLRAAEPAPLLPPFREALEALGGFEAAVKAMDTRAQREVLVTLIDHVTPRRAGLGAYTAEVAWTPLGEALRRAGAELDPAG